MIFADEAEVRQKNGVGRADQSETDTAALLELVSDMEDLVIQFDSTDLGQRFIESWKRAHIILDNGGGHGGVERATPMPAPEKPK